MFSFRMIHLWIQGKTEPWVVDHPFLKFATPPLHKKKKKKIAQKLERTNKTAHFGDRKAKNSIHRLWIDFPFHEVFFLDPRLELVFICAVFYRFHFTVSFCTCDSLWWLLAIVNTQNKIASDLFFISLAQHGTIDSFFGTLLFLFPVKDFDSVVY